MTSHTMMLNLGLSDAGMCVCSRYTYSLIELLQSGNQCHLVDGLILT